MKADADKENLCGTKNKNELRSYMKRYKNAMIEKHLPIKETRLNDLLQKHAGPGNPLAPLYWNNRGRPEIAPIRELADAHDAHQSIWERDDTKSFLFDAKKQNAIEKGLDPTSVKEPNQHTIEMPGKKVDMSKPKSLQKDMGETP